MHGWAENLRRRFGAGAPERVREALGQDLSEAVPEAPRSADWIPVGAHLRCTEVMIDTFCQGDAAALYPMVFEDTVRALPTGARFALRGLGLRRVLSKAPGVHRRLYDVGRVEVERLERSSARLCFTGAELFEHPTWQLLQSFATRMLFELMGRGRGLQLEAQAPAAGSFALELTW